MPHLVILYTGNLDAVVDMPALCRELADAMLGVRDEAGAQVFPTGGTRVLAYPAPHFAVADGGAAGRAAGAGKTGVSSGDPGEYGFMYLNLRMGRGRSDATQKRAGNALLESASARLNAVMATRHIGLTVQIDEGPEVFDAKHSTLHPLFKKN
ncbi:5-carboxymethyl-2-hydroxymuconate isomerase [Ottowia sp.]|uniref:5-carboxymethyl-2-hydroxymuconate isomerase n=1 Tax=Ottowia sp. TaxID=1898956 RepID=UPI002BA682F4|nr:5-carboxymethyl-2-hydroxymuconate isomerase [Ottowia sp.]HOB67710.1 5-carboxymethyl-2-hydroxymuconate isomerase [Ottowia sp.]HPZ57090.1 5-carboxymethyl-2-hydroxymuconate isomerase [Ottowia sp.]HQD49299.1 5-carboxymethyl-2-hydroxymuconate isomerase [Ottowia sp.]